MEEFILIKITLYKLCELANKAGIEKVFVHAFTDGRDCDPKSGIGFIQAVGTEFVWSKNCFNLW